MAKIQLSWDASPTPGITSQEIMLGEKGQPLKGPFTLTPDRLTYEINVPGGGKTVEVHHVVIKTNAKGVALRSEPAILTIVVDDDKPKPVVNFKSNVVPDA